MAKTRYFLIILFAFVLLISGFLILNLLSVNIYVKNIKKYSFLVKNEPNNCFYNDQLADNYLILHEYNKAKIYFEVLIHECENNSFYFQQYGICNYLNGNDKIGLEYIDKAIEKEKAIKNYLLADSYKKEKLDLIKNKGNIRKYKDSNDKRKWDYFFFNLSKRILFLLYRIN